MYKYVHEFFSLESNYVDRLRKLKANFGYNGFGEIVFYRTYSRIKTNGTGDQENWHDVVIRVINGTMSIRKDWYTKNNIEWNERYWQGYAYKMAISLFKMYWMPGGRGMWAMGTAFVYDRGAMALNNCGATKLGGNDTLSDDLNWMMDALMLGVGVGFEPIRDELTIYKPQGTFIHYVQDNRESWVDSWRLLINAYIKPNTRKPQFRFDHVRKRGLPIRGFGGLSSGPEPLAQLFRETEELFETTGIDVVRLKTDLANKCGVCVVAGNVRRSAELCQGGVFDPIFMDLKDYQLYPERESFGWMSNNSVALYDDVDFDQLGEVARRVVIRGEPGVINLRNFKYGRIGKQIPVREDDADLLNPCAEVPLKNKELCNVAETLPTQCPTVEAWYEACEFATFYTSTVSLLPTHRPETNQVILRNRRIAVSIIDWTGWVLNKGLYKVTAYMRKGYDVVTKTNQNRNAEAGVPESIRKTTIKPGGTGPKLPGKTPGIGYPTFKETLRRIRVASNNPICAVLDDANIPYTPDHWDQKGTRVYEYPTIQGPSQPADEISLWEQAINLVTVQREWADNSVSNTLYFRPKWKLVLMRDASVLFVEVRRLLPTDYTDADIKRILSEDAQTIECGGFKIVTKINKYSSRELYIYKYDPNHEEDIIEKVLSAIVPLIKACSLLPHSAKGAYRQMPEEGLTEKEYKARLAKIKPIDWSKFGGSDGLDEKYCTSDHCEVPVRKL